MAANRTVLHGTGVVIPAHNSSWSTELHSILVMLLLSFWPWRSHRSRQTMTTVSSQSVHVAVNMEEFWVVTITPILQDLCSHILQLL